MSWVRENRVPSSTGGGWKRSVDHWSAAKCVRGKRRAWGAGTYRRSTPPRRPPTLLTFRARGARRKDGTGFTSFLPAVSKDALTRMGAVVRSWRLHRRTGHTLTGLAAAINPIIRGWQQYYGAFYRSALHGLLSRINAYLLRWIRRKYERLRPFTKAKACWQRITVRCPLLFAHWRWTRSAW